ncbi:MAG: hypothetical protein RJA59_1634, partial [Pseudomonadota bacterium]
VTKDDLAFMTEWLDTRVSEVAP